MTLKDCGKNMIKIISIGHKEPDWINIAIENYINKIN